MRRFEISTPQDYNADCKIPIHSKARFDNLFLVGVTRRKILQDLAHSGRNQASTVKPARTKSTLPKLKMRSAFNAVGHRRAERRNSSHHERSHDTLRS
jgi:hypothetical protein